MANIRGCLAEFLAFNYIHLRKKNLTVASDECENATPPKLEKEIQTFITLIIPLHVFFFTMNQIKL